MSIPRFFVEKENISDSQIVISGAEHVHLSSALRIKVGEKVDVCVGDGVIYHCEICQVDKKQTLAKVLDQTIESSECKIYVFVALISADRMDWEIQKLTELGAYAIIPFESEYCTVKDKGNKADRLKRIALSACKQSGRAILPIIENTLTFDQMLSRLSDFDQKIVAYENDDHGAKDVLSKLDKTKPIAIIFGSEGGFAENEIQKLVDINTQVISLGKNILRAETASIALLSALNYELGLWGKNK